MQTGLPMSTIIILSAVIPSTVVLLMIVCHLVLIILIVRWRISARKQVDAAHEQTGKLGIGWRKVGRHPSDSSSIQPGTCSYNIQVFRLQSCNYSLIFPCISHTLTTLTHCLIGSTELNASASELEHFEMNTNGAYATNAAEITTTGNVAYVTAEDATQNVAYRQVPPGTDDYYDYVV